MKTFNLVAVILGLVFIVPTAAMASTDDFDRVTIEAVELNDDNSASVTNEVEVPEAEDINDHRGEHASSGHSEIEAAEAPEAPEAEEAHEAAEAPEAPEAAGH